ncbi:isoamylase [Amycolatopsis sp. NPDC051128]|uniref:isoamylase n=1 Tax=Amycolatopsis sp. NPDC051128 TaxID=3155412 RepID=UPI00342978B2
MIKISKSLAGTQRVTFSLPLEAPPGQVSVVGCFNEWTPGRHPLTPRSNGRRSVSVDVAPGAVIQFRYLGEDGFWFDDPDLPDRADGNCVCVTN